MKSPENEKYEKALEKMSPFEIKSTLIDLAENDAKLNTATFLNAGRGNPNWILSYPRKAFFLLGDFAMQEADRFKYDESIGIVESPKQEGMARRFVDYITSRKKEIGAKVLNHFYTHMTTEMGADPDELVFELVDGILGDHYPTPPRILKYTEQIIRE